MEVSFITEEMISVTADIISVGNVILLLLVLIKSKDLIKDFFIALIYGDPNDPDNYIEQSKGS